MIVRDLWFVRHGESEHHVQGLTGGWTDTPLTERGNAQVRATADYLVRAFAHRAPEVVITSDLRRARQTADIIARAIGADVQTTPLLREINNGLAAGLTLAAADRIKRVEPVGRSMDYRPYEGAETFAELQDRLDAALAFVATIPASTHLVVGHGLSGQCLVRSWLGLSLELEVSFHFDPASCSHLAINQWQEREIRQLNVCPWS